jgi:hypothetical protein
MGLSINTFINAENINRTISGKKRQNLSTMWCPDDESTSKKFRPTLEYGSASYPLFLLRKGLSCPL